jgi:hypothetical protein
MINFIADVWRFWMSQIGFQYVILIDYDGESCVRRIINKAGKPAAWRYWPFRVVWLLDGGKTTGTLYVDRWVPYTPFQPVKMPKPPHTTPEEGIHDERR